MADTTTPKLGMTLPEVGASSETWGSKINADLSLVDSLFDTGPVLKLTKGGTGAATAADARTNLGLGTMATQAASSIAVTGGTISGATISGITDLAVADGGTGASTAANARTNLGLGALAVKNTIATADVDSEAITPAKLSPDVSITPTGSILAFAGSSSPANWLLCHGQAISRVTYAALFAVLGATYGSGDGSTTFNLPDLRGRVIAGQDDMGGTSANRLTGLSGGVDGDVLGGTGGAESHTLTEAQMPSHKHALLANVSGPGTLTTTNQANFEDQTLGDSQYTIEGSSTAATLGLSSATGGGAAHNNVQPTLILNYIIKV